MREEQARYYRRALGPVAVGGMCRGGLRVRRAGLRHNCRVLGRSQPWVVLTLEFSRVLKGVGLASGYACRILGCLQRKRCVMLACMAEMSRLGGLSQRAQVDMDGDAGNTAECFLGVGAEFCGLTENRPHGRRQFMFY